MTDRPAPPDPDRRRFFRQFAGDVVTSVGTVMGAAQTIQQTSAEAARELLAGEPLAATASSARAGSSRPTTSRTEVDASSAGYRTPFRWDGDVCLVVDQRRLPDVLTELEVRGTADAVTAINDGALVGAPVQAQVAAVTLAILAARASTSRPFARRATIRGAANALRLSRPGSAPMAAALDRMLAIVELAGADADGAALAAALRAEAEHIVAEASDDYGALVGHVISALPGAVDEALHVMLAGSTGAMGTGPCGGALYAAVTAHHAGRPVHALVAEGRPGLEGSRVAAWELRQAGVPHAVVTDAAAPGCIVAGEVRVVLVGADRIAANGDIVTTVGAYPLALAAAAAGVPFIACAATTAVDPGVPEGADATVEEGRPGPVLRAAGTRVTPEGTHVRNPVQDLVPAALVSAIVTETGVLVAPFGPALASSVAAAAVRRMASPGFAALVAQREAAAAEAASETDAAPGADRSGRAPVDVAAVRNPPATARTPASARATGGVGNDADVTTGTPA